MFCKKYFYKTVELKTLNVFHVFRSDDIITKHHTLGA